jgi:hypothetical protein
MGMTASRSTGGSASSSQPPAPDHGSLPVMGGAYTTEASELGQPTLSHPVSAVPPVLPHRRQPARRCTVVVGRFRESLCEISQVLGRSRSVK